MSRTIAHRPTADAPVKIRRPRYSDTRAAARREALAIIADTHEDNQRNG